MAPVLLVLAIAFALVPVFVSVSLPMAILFSCCAMGIAGTSFPNALFPVIPRLLDPFHPLAGLATLMIISITINMLIYPAEALEQE
jgi:hypothetical protein